MSSQQTNLSHKARRAGVSHDRKKEREKLKKGAQDGKKPVNMKAFTFSSIVSAQRKRVQAAEVEHRRHHGHMERKDLVDNPPPKVVAVAGPPGSGKTTLIKCLTKYFSRSPTFDCVGPVSCIADANTRITFVEVPNDIGAMIDSAKTADLVLLTIDASFGFELETFEYLNILKTHGFPKVFGVLTHVDHFKTNTALGRVKKRMKKRFQQEVVDGAKFFHVSGLIHGRYPRREILNIGRYITVTKSKPQQFRNDHSYVVVDRVEDMTHPGLIHQNPVCDRTVALYGYVRGTSMKPGQNVHLLGVGDFQVKDLQVLDDPLPLLKHVKNETQEDKEKRRTLKKQNIKIHAPFSDIGNVMYDKDAVYIKMRSHKVRVSDTQDLTMLGSSTKNTAEDLLQQRQDVERRLGKISEHEQFIKSLQEKYNVGSLSGMTQLTADQKGDKLDQMLANQTKISLFDNDDSITSKQFEELRQYRAGATALPGDALDAQEEGEDGFVKKNIDPLALGAHDVDEDENFLFGGAQGNNNNAAAAAKKDDDFYQRISIKEVVGADGRIRKQIVFNNQLPGEDDMNDGDDDEEEEEEEQNYGYDENDNDDGYYSDDDEQQQQYDDEDDEMMMMGEQEGEFDYHDLFSQYGDLAAEGEMFDEDDFDLDEEDLEYSNMKKQNKRTAASYTQADFPDYDEDDDEDMDDMYEDEDDMDENEMVQLNNPKHTISNDKLLSQRNTTNNLTQQYNLSNFLKGGVHNAAYQSLSNVSNQSNTTQNDGDDFFISTRTQQQQQQQQQQASKLSGLSLMDLVYGSKNTLFETNQGGIFGGTGFNDINQQDQQQQQQDEEDPDDFFVMRHNIDKAVQRQRGGGSAAPGSTAGTATSTQGSFAHSHLNNAATMLDPKSANNNISGTRDLAMFDQNMTIDTTFVLSNEKMLQDWLDDDIRTRLQNRFVTGDWDAAADKYNGQNGGGDGDDQDEDDEDERHYYRDEEGNKFHVPEEYLTDDETLPAAEKTKRRKLRLEWQRKKAFGIKKDINESWGDEAFGKRRRKNDADKMYDADEQLFGDFEEVGSDNDDMEDITGKGSRGGNKKKALSPQEALVAEKLRKKQALLGLNLDDMEREALSDERQLERERLEAKLNKDNRGEKKLALNKQILRDHFDYFQAQHQHIMEKVEKNKEEMKKLSDEERLILFGSLPGTYVRILLTQVPCEFIEHLNPAYPIILGGLQPTEQNMGYLNMRVKKHRWFHRLLKSNDPLIFSSGWRRFQSIPAYYVEDATGRHRYLKYTPEHLHCLATTYAPLVTVNSGIIAFKNVYMASKSIDMTNKSVSTFRVALTGVVLDVDKKLDIRKKLKLIGTPLQIFNKTAYVQGMFNTTLEVAKFEGAKIQTVSGIPGRIVKALTHDGKEGCFRATFNDKVVKSDIIMCKTFAPVKLYKYYNPVTSLLLANKSGWKGMRTTKEIRADKGQVIKHNKDNDYVDIVREKRKFAALKIPAQLAAALPFKSKQKLNREAAFADALKKKEKKMLRNKQLDEDFVADKIKSMKARKTKYEDSRAKFVDKKTVKYAGFVNNLTQMSVLAQRNQDELRKKKEKRIIGNTTENRDRIERMKDGNKKRKYQADAKKAIQQNGGAGKRMKRGAGPPRAPKS